MDGLNGQVINLISNDVVTLDYATCFLQELWVGPVEAIIMGYFIYREIKFYGLIGIGVMLLFIPLQAWMGRMAAKIRLSTALRTDTRLKFMNEIIQGVQVIKMYAWEKVFASNVADVRTRELNMMRRSAYIKAALLSFHVLPQIAIFLSFVTYAYFNQDGITARKAFIVIAYFNALLGSLVDFWPLAITSVAEGYVSIKRVEKFLLIDESKVKMVTKLSPEHDDALRVVTNTDDVNKGIVLRGASSYWTKNEQAIVAIKDVNLSMNLNQLYAIVGQVGAGKSSLLQVILGELEIDYGSVLINGTISYASQSPWVYEGTIKENIIFNEGYDEEKYRKVINVTGLSLDLEQLPYGDQTLVGEKGISLSGGQKARCNLARAIYKDADIYILDDPLSAVDVNVGKIIFDRCINGYLKGKVCVLVTHQVQFASQADYIVVLNKGKIKYQGTYNDLKADSTVAHLFTSNYLGSANGSDSVTKDTVADGDGTEEEMKTKSNTEANGVGKLPSGGGNGATQQANKEKQLEGAVEMNVYTEYFRSAKNWFVIAIIFILFLVTQTLMSGASYFVSVWTNWEEQNKASAEPPQSSWSTNRFVYIYSAIIVLLIIAIILRSFSFFMMCIRISANLHNMLYEGVIRAKMYFFNVNSSGRILNRFSRDIGTIDSFLPTVLVDTINFFFELIGVVVLVSIVNYWLIIPTAVMAVIFYFLRYTFLTTARNVKRAEAITRSPIYSDINATLNGLSTIKAFEGEEPAIVKFQDHQDVNTSASFLFIATTRGFAFWLDIVSALYLTVVTYAFLVLGQDTVGGNVGLAITQVINLVGMCNWGLRQTSELENQMTSVERVAEYANLPSEPPLETEPNKQPPSSWPDKARVDFQKVSLKYSDDTDYVLKEINFAVQPQEKVGIVGRTGAGKSSITQALFRLTDYEGHIIIDSVDLKELGLHTFRSKISVIPQDPVLFSGTLRANIDQFNEHTDNQIWTVLEQVQLRPMISESAGGLDSIVSDGGSNFSIGQRQLICLARALIRNNRILVLDEATANVDAETDKLIQETIRRHCNDCTILTIAHRINTVMDYDRIIVMDSGCIIENDTVEALLVNRDGVFTQMVKESGIDGEKYKKNV